MRVTVPVARRLPRERAALLRGVTDAWVKKAVAAALRGADVKGAVEVGIVFVSDREMIRLNASHRGRRKTTDVLSFADGEHGLLGDVIISVAQAGRQAEHAGHPLRTELAMLLVHGTLHLLGYDHETVRDEKVMFPLQKRILKKLGYGR